MDLSDTTLRCIFIQYKNLIQQISGYGFTGIFTRRQGVPIRRLTVFLGLPSMLASDFPSLTIAYNDFSFTYIFNLFKNAGSSYNTGILILGSGNSGSIGNWRFQHYNSRRIGIFLRWHRPYFWHVLSFGYRDGRL